MKLRYLDTAAFGLRWMRRYYRQNRQLDLRRAAATLRRAEDMLKEFPYSGEPYEDSADIRELHLPGTAFSILYSVARDTVWVIDIRDTRGNRSAEALRAFTRSLRDRPP